MFDGVLVLVLGVGLLGLAVTIASAFVLALLSLISPSKHSLFD